MDVPPVLWAARDQREKEGGAGLYDPPALWVAFVSALPRWFAPPITTVPAEGPSAESFDRSLPRHPFRKNGPGACFHPRSRFRRSTRAPLLSVDSNVTCERVSASGDQKETIHGTGLCVVRWHQGGNHSRVRARG